jgi:hypothetical protein
MNYSTVEVQRTHCSKVDAVKAISSLRHFIGQDQLYVIADLCRSAEEKQFFFDKVAELARITAVMPKVYEQDGKGDNALAHLHYFTGGCDWYITERDTSHEQHQAFGLADLGYGPELGYISIAELIEAGAEIDLHFTPKTLAQIKGRN